MRNNKKFDYGKGKYYLTVNSIPNNITLSRDNALTALNTFKKYDAVGKQVEWLGQWNGKKFVETNLPKESEQSK